MNSVKLRAEFHAKRLGRQIRHGFTPGSIIVIYHRIDEDAHDPWQLAVSPTHFAEHLGILARWGTPMSLSRMAELAMNGALPRRSIAITFDDGYVDNLHHAKPILEAHGVPATVFVTAAFMRRETEFWWDELQRIVLLPNTFPDALSLEIGSKTIHWNVLADRAGQSFRDRLSLHDAVWRSIQPLSYQDRRASLDRLHDLVGTPRGSRTDVRPLEAGEIVELAQGGLIEIGSHTISHSSLRDLSLTELREEIVGAKTGIEELLGQSVAGFSYPFGETGSALNNIDKIVREAGFDWACTSGARAIRGQCNPYFLPRFAIPNWSGASFTYHFVSRMLD
ncbi:polysaccharide deacetylase family protein [soil metagenome]